MNLSYSSILFDMPVPVFLISLFYAYVIIYVYP